MEKIKTAIRNLSLQKSIALYIVVFVVLALFLGNLTAGLCSWESDRILEKYNSRKEKYYLTNEKGEQLGEGAYIWNSDPGMKKSDEMALDLLDVIPAVMYPVYSAIGVAAAAMCFYKKKLKRPLELLTEASAKISANELDFSLEYENRDEMGALCRSFEIMRSALEKNQIQMWRSIEERKRLNAAFAHDLRTPLTVLKGYTEMLQLSDGENEKKTADIMAKHIRRMEKYVESMSSIRRLEDRELNARELQMKQYLTAMEKTGEIFCEKKGRKFVFDSRISSERMCLDSELILEAYHNLLSNAARYSRERVSVCMEETEKGICLTVTDDGKGFSQKAMEKASEPGKTAEGHFGLGLYICKILCRQHGGRLEIGNTDVGARVSAFFMSMPFYYEKVDKK